MDEKQCRSSLFSQYGNQKEFRKKKKIVNSVQYYYWVKYSIFVSFRLVLHDGFKDVLGWNNPENLNVNTDLVQYLENQTGYHANHSVAIVIDSLSPLMLHRPAPYTCQVLSKLTRSKIKSKFKPLIKNSTQTNTVAAVV